MEEIHFITPENIKFSVPVSDIYSFCEKYCACNKQLCKLSWNGCHCKGPCNSSLCPCFVNNRECDYDLCQSKNYFYILIYRLQD